MPKVFFEGQFFSPFRCLSISIGNSPRVFPTPLPQCLFFPSPIRYSLVLAGGVVRLYKDGSNKRCNGIPVPCSQGAFVDGFASMDITLDDTTGVWARIFLPDCAARYDGRDKKSSESIGNKYENYQQHKSCLGCCPRCLCRYRIDKSIRDWKRDVSELWSQRAQRNFPPVGEYGDPTPRPQVLIQNPKSDFAADSK
jgi:hypothetical protein